jgi:hypothetical protein
LDFLNFLGAKFLILKALALNFGAKISGMLFNGINV